MKSCCKEWLDKKCEPQEPKKGIFSEIQKYSSCRKKWLVRFKAIEVIGKEEPIEYVVISADPLYLYSRKFKIHGTPRWQLPDS
jgi:hypothetical protein